jgi:hypothetical protein
MNWSTTEAITLSIAVIGAVLGIVNTVFSLWQKRVRLRVRVMMAFDPEDRDLGENGLPKKQSVAIEVTNLSEFPVTIQSTGFAFRSRLGIAIRRAPILKIVAGSSKDYLIIKNPRLAGRSLSDRTLPARLDSRESLVAMPRADEHKKPQFRDARRAFVLTACGVMRTGPYPASLKPLAT